jgi:MFS family permease
MRNYLSLLRRNPGYARLWSAQAVSLLGDWFSFIAISTWISSATSGSGMAVSGLLLTQLLPPVLIGPFAGVLVDRMDRKLVMIISDFGRALLRLLLLLVLAGGQIWPIYLITVLHFSLSAVFEPARSALMPSLVHKEDLVRANVLSSITWSVMLALGGITGGTVTESLGIVSAIVINAGTFALSGIFILMIRPKHVIREVSVEEQQAHKNEASFMDGIRYALRHPATAASLFIKSGSVGSVDALIIIYGTQVFVMGDNGGFSVGVLFTAFGLGAIAGPLLFNLFNDGSTKRMRRLVRFAYLLNVLGWTLFGLAPSLWIAAAGIMLRSIGGSTGWTYSSIIIQKSVADNFLGRMFAIDLALVQFTGAVTVAITGWAVDYFTAERAWIVVLGTAVAAFVPFVLWWIAVPWVERHDPVEQVAEPISQPAISV